MKTFAPKTLHGAMLRELLEELQATPAQVAKYLHVTERSVWRWLADDSAPYAALAALWLETATGRYTVALDVGNEATILRGLADATGAELKREKARVSRLMLLGDFGCANDPIMDGPPPVGPGGHGQRPRIDPRPVRLNAFS